jgi:hypothetical protein
MRVDQTGESILFAWGDGFVEAHVQISYDGNEATKFAWVVPVQVVPEIEVGSARLFQAVLDSTQPIYGHDTASECQSSGTGGGGGVGFIQDPDGGGVGNPPPPFDPPPQIVIQSVVGAFDYVVLEGGTASSVTDWLASNGYATADEAPAILDDYIAEGFVFVAFKLRHESGIKDLHPIVLRYAGDEPCVPLRLTRVASVEDMPIRVLALSDARAYPSNWRHVLLNRTRLDWIVPGSNYDLLVGRAIDEPGSDGRGFVTEYAGGSHVVDRSVMTLNDLDASAFETIDVIDVYAELYRQNLIRCDDLLCTYAHELVPSLLHEFVPVPDGVGEAEFYSCLSCYADLIDAAAWDAAAFAAAFDERIVAPLEHAHELLDRWPTLTRLFTLVSPWEMTSDPTFVRVPDAPNVPFEYWALTQGECCNMVRVPGGRQIELEGGAWPSWPDEMPWAERIEEVPPDGGPPIELVNRSAEIDALVGSRWDECAPGNPDDDGGGEAGGYTTAASGWASDGSSSDDAGQASSEGGCGCGSTTASPFAVIVGIAVVRRRRKASR